ncbi:hypothetical protein HN873_028739, partial [Arachis hypogaea]
PLETYKADLNTDLKKHHALVTFLDKMAYWTVKSLRFPTDLFFQLCSYHMFYANVTAYECFPFFFISFSYHTNALFLYLYFFSSVYEGEKPFYKEKDIAIPVHVYGKTKDVAEQFISENYSSYAILRSSIIYEPQTVSPVPKSLPIQWMDGVLAKGEEVQFFHDEFCCPIFIKDLVNIILALPSL